MLAFMHFFSSSDGFDLGHMKNRRWNEKTKNGCPFVASLLWIWHSLWLGGKSELFQFICLIMRTICSFCLCKLLIISIFIFKIEIFFHCEFLKKWSFLKDSFKQSNEQRQVLIWYTHTHTHGMGCMWIQEHHITA